MHIILGRENIEATEVDQKFTVLELDTFRLPPEGKLVQAFCVIENLPITNMHRVTEMKDLHKNLLINFRQQDWNYCEQAMEHLMGFWGHEMDTFYQSLCQRITELKNNPPGPQWDAVINKSTVHAS
jgi:hypothetical protein